MQRAGYRLIHVRATGDISHWALVDPEDHERFSGYHWHLAQGYAQRSAPKPSTRTFLLHREILGLVHGDGHETDHKNRDRLDCRRSNLRVVTHAVNGRNVPSQQGTSQYRGVWLDERYGSWIGQARLDRVKHHLGSFRSEAEAAVAVNAFWVERGYEAPNMVATS